MIVIAAIPSEEGFHTFHRAVESAKELGGLDPSAIWALMAICLLIYLWYARNEREKADEEWRRIREEEVKADLELSLSVRKMVDILMKQQVIIDERLPRR